MYKNSIIVLVKKDGQPLRETDGKFVYLPFNSEYSLEIKNQTWKRAIASIKIDGTDVLGGDEIIIPAQGSVPIERFITNGDLSSGKKFKFVPLSDSKVQDPSSPENGLLEVEVWFEKQPEITIPYTPPTPLRRRDSGWPKPYWSDPDWYVSTSMGAMSNEASSVTYGGKVTCMSFTSNNIIPDSGVAGATVEGGKSNQSFVNGYFGQKDYPSVAFKFWLRGVAQEVTSEDKLYCVSCGKKSRFDYKFCPRCGAPIQIA